VDKRLGAQEPDIEYCKPKIKGVVMGVKGTCWNCGRENMSLPARGLCGLCDRFWREAPANGKEIALAAAKKRVEDGVLYKPIAKKAKGMRREAEGRVGKVTESQEPEAVKKKPTPVPYKFPEVEAWGTMLLEFKTRLDLKILEWLNNSAEVHRRRPDQQIMWILQNIHAEAEGADNKV
jgi:hypothetical protein